MREIPLHRSTQVALVDDYHHAWLMQHTWSLQKCRANRTCYAYRMERSPEGRPVRIYMHREIMGLEDGDPREADHRDGNGLRNLESNLRIVTPLQNAANRPLQVRSRTGYKGVSPQKSGKFRAAIKSLGLETFLGDYPIVHEAGMAYNEAALALFGEHARLNQIPDDAITPLRQEEIRQKVALMLTRPRRDLSSREGPPSRVYRDNVRDRWKAAFKVGHHMVHIGSYHDKSEADYAAALALDANAIPDPTIKPARLEFIKKRVAYLHSIHQAEPEPAGT